MQPISFAVAALLGLVALIFVLYPLYRRPASQPQTQAGEAQGPSEREQNARRSLHEVEFDFQLGNLDEKEYRSLRTRYMNRALIEMKNRHQRDKEIDEEIEAELLRLKEAAHEEESSDAQD